MAFRGIQSTNIISTEVGFTDPVLILNKDGSTAVDVGFLGKIGSTSYAGLVKDSTTEDFILISSINLSSTSVNNIDATDLSIVKGSITVGTLTADTIVAGNLPTQYTDALARASISATGSLSYDSTTGVISFTDSDSSYATLVGYNPADETDTSSIVLDPGDASTPATFRGDVINNSGAVIVDVSSTSTTFTGGLMGNTYGDVYNPTGANKILESGTGNLDSSLTVDTANATTLNATTTNISGIATFTGGSVDFTGTTTIGNWNGAVYDRTGGTLIIEDNASPNPIVHADLDGDVTGTVSDISNHDTDDLSEGSTNLYYTNARTDARVNLQVGTNLDLSGKSTNNLPEGTNLYYTNARTDARVNLQVGTNLDLSGKSTSNLPEGTNLYYTDARADARAQLKIDATVDSAPGTLDTLNELAAALGDDANFSTTVTNSIAAKLPLAGGTLTGDLSVSANVYLTAGVDARIQLGTSGSGANSDSDNSVYVRGNDDHLILSAAGNGSISLKENADTRMYIATGGNTGIGTTSPGSKLSVSGPAALANLGGGSTGSSALYVNSTSGHVGELIQVLRNSTTKMHMANDGKLGLGTSSPSSLLHLYDSTSTSSSTTGTTLLTLDNYVGSDLNQQKTFIDFRLFDDNTNETPQVRIGAEVGANTDANTQEMEGEGAFVVYTNDTSGTSGTATGLNERLRVSSNGNVGIGTSTPSSTLHVVGSILATADITAYSDDSLKTNVQVIDNAVGKVEQLRGVTFDRIEDGSTSTGVIAQELKEVLPEAVHTDEQGVHSVAYGNVVGLLIEAIKEQQKQIDELIKANKS